MAHIVAASIKPRRKARGMPCALPAACDCCVRVRVHVTCDNSVRVHARDMCAVGHVKQARARVDGNTTRVDDNSTRVKCNTTRVEGCTT